jgi:hypothetical protein
MSNTDNAEAWELLAEEARSVAARLTCAEARHILIQAAERYDRMARRAREGVEAIATRRSRATTVACL